LHQQPDRDRGARALPAVGAVMHARLAVIVVLGAAWLAARPARADEHATGDQQPRAKSTGVGPRDATRGGVDPPAFPAERGREGPLSIEAAPGSTAMCIDQEIADRLAIKRKRRGAVDRLFVKQGRHELSAAGGYYASDLLSGTYIVGGSYAYHMTDETAV